MDEESTGTAAERLTENRETEVDKKGEGGREDKTYSWRGRNVRRDMYIRRERER